MLKTSTNQNIKNKNQKKKRTKIIKYIGGNITSTMDYYPTIMVIIF